MPSLTLPATWWQAAERALLLGAPFAGKMLALLRIYIRIGNTSIQTLMRFKEVSSCRKLAHTYK